MWEGYGPQSSAFPVDVPTKERVVKVSEPLLDDDLEDEEARHCNILT